MAANSIRYTVSQDLRILPLDSIKVWSTNGSYQNWCLSLCFPYPHRRFVCIQLRINANSGLYNPIAYRNTALPRATTTLFIASESLFSTDNAREIITIPFNSQNRPNPDNVYNVLSQNMPGYQLPEGKGTQGWAVYVLQYLMDNGYLPTNTMSILEMRIDALRMSNSMARNGIPKFSEIPYGIIY